MIINKANIKTLLGISVSTYDTQIDAIYPILLDQICSYCNNDFVKINWANYPVHRQCDLTTTSTTITTTTDVSLFVVGDFIRLYGTEYNDGLYQIKTNTGGVITIETAKTLRPETGSGYIALIDFPNEFLNVIAKYIDTTIVNDSNVKREKVPDYEVEYFTPNDTSSYINKNSSILNVYRKVYKDRHIGGL